jgi:AcrR family transcriptional regulator
MTAAPPKRDAARSRRSILDAALAEFAEHGHAGARIDAIAEAAGVSKPMIYSYFGDKDELWSAALRESYVQIRAGERALDLDGMAPEASIRALVRFTMAHFVGKPWFISMLKTENLRGDTTVRRIADLDEIQSPLIDVLRKLLARGVAAGAFRDGVDPVDLYVTVASLCYFPVSNAHTLRAVFRCPIDAAWLERHGEEAGEMVVRYLRPTAADRDA